MRILMLDNEYPPLGGGTGVVNYHLLKEFAAYDDLDIDMVTSSRTRHQYEAEQFAERIHIFKVPVDNQNIHHSTNPELLRYAWRSFHYSRNLIKRHHYDLGFAFAGVPAGAISYALKKIYHLPYLVSLQGPDVPGFEARYNYLYPVLRPILRVVWRNANAVTAISQDHQRLAYDTLSSINIPIIPNGVETDMFHPAVGNRTEPLNVLCVGRLIERKGQQHLLRAFAHTVEQRPDRAVRLVLVGTGDAENRLRQLAVQLGIIDRVCFAGVIPGDAMPDLYRQADVFVLPSQNEGMSIALLEALASGLPVIVTPTGGTSELVMHEDNGLVVPWADVAGLTAALGQLLDNPGRRVQMGAASRRRAMCFGWQSIAATYRQLFEQILDSDTSKA